MVGERRRSGNHSSRRMLRLEDVGEDQPDGRGNPTNQVLRLTGRTGGVIVHVVNARTIQLDVAAQLTRLETLSRGRNRDRQLRDTQRKQDGTKH